MECICASLLRIIPSADVVWMGVLIMTTKCYMYVGHVYIVWHGICFLSSVVLQPNIWPSMAYYGEYVLPNLRIMNTNADHYRPPQILKLLSNKHSPSPAETHTAPQFEILSTMNLLYSLTAKDHSRVLSLKNTPL